MSHQADADREFAHWYGEEHPDQCWILSDRDVWYLNPFYNGPMQAHPEDPEENES
jgi:hypothetical protein